MNQKKEKITFRPYKGEEIKAPFLYQKGAESIVHFFNRSAKKCIQELTSTVFVMRDKKSEIVGFMAISLKSIDKKHLAKKKTRGLFSRPAITIGQLIIDKRSQGKGYGKTAIRFVIFIAFTLRKFLPCRLLVVEAINDQAKNFYEHNGFQSSLENPYTLILDLLPIINAASDKTAVW